MHCSLCQSSPLISLWHCDCLKWLRIARLPYPPLNRPEPAWFQRRTTKLCETLHTHRHCGSVCDVTTTEKMDFQLTILRIHFPNSLCPYLKCWFVEISNNYPAQGQLKSKLKREKRRVLMAIARLCIATHQPHYINQGLSTLCNLRTCHYNNNKVQ